MSDPGENTKNDSVDKPPIESNPNPPDVNGGELGGVTCVAKELPPPDKYLREKMKEEFGGESESCPEKNEDNLKKAADRILKKSSHDAFSGFYYDQQILDKSLTMTLHCNRIPLDETGKEWTAPNGSKKADSEGYCLEPLATAIISEDFQVGIHNEWSDGGGVDDISGLFNSMKSYAPYIGEAGKKFTEAGEAGEDVAAEAQADGKTWAFNMNNVMKWLGANSHRLEDVMNRAIVVQGTRFSYYNGTGIAFGNMSMKVMYFSDWNPQTGLWESCYDKLNKLVPYMIGPYKKWNENQEKDDGWNKFIGWQLPPGDFRADLKTVDVVQRGTLKVRFANLYSISNLVVNDVQINFSKSMVKCPMDGYIDIYPLYCEVNITLKPAAKYTGEKFIESISGQRVVENRLVFNREINTRLRDLNNY